MPQEQIRDPPSPLLILLRHDLAHRRQALPVAIKRPHHRQQVLQLKRPIDAHDARLPLMLPFPDSVDDLRSQPVADVGQAAVDLARARGVEGVGEEVERAALVRGLEDVGHVREEDVGEEVAEQRAHDAAFAVVALPARGAVRRQAHGFDAAFAAAFELVEPDGFGAAATGGVRGAVSSAFGRGRAVLDADAGDGALDGFGEADVQEVVLLAFGDLELFLELQDAFLEVVVVDEMAVAVLEAVLAGGERDAFPVFFSRFFRLGPCGGD